MAKCGVSMRTVALILRPMPEQAGLLFDLQCAYSAACNYASAVHWD
jgi:hypothetical protein